MADPLIDLAGLRVGAEGLLVAILEAASQPLWVVDPGGVIRFANRAAITALGYGSAAELLGRDSHETIDPKLSGAAPSPATECRMLLPLTTGETVSSELDWFFRRDGSMFPVSYVSVPIEMPEGRGAVVAFAVVEDPLEVLRSADEQAALRRVATLVARGTRPEDVFAAVATEVGRLLAVDSANVCRYESDRTVTFVASAGALLPVGSRWPLDGQTNLATLVLETGRPSRLDNYADATGPLAEDLRGAGVRSAVATPIVVEGRLWGLIAAGSGQERPLPPDTEMRLASFTELVAAAIANAEARAELGRLVDEQAALRRVATLVAEGAAPSEVFATVTREVGILCGADLARMERYASGESVIGVAVWSREDAPELAVGTRFSLEGASIAAQVKEASRPVRVDSFAGAQGPIAQEAQGLGIRSSVGCPIVVEGRLWGVIAASSKSATPFPADTESQIAEFTELVATAVANTESHATANRLMEEQAALRRVAMLVADGAAPAAVFDAVAAEMAGLLGADGVTLGRYEPDEEVTIVVNRGLNAELLPPGTRTSHNGENVTSWVRRSEQPARMESYDGACGAVAEHTRGSGVRASVATPIVVDGRLWGVTIAHWGGEKIPPADSEQRMAHFAELLDTAIANADSRDQLTASRVRLVTASDDARRRVVRDLHDGAQQRLVHAIVTLKLAQKALRQNDDGAAPLIDEALEQAEKGNAELRELAHGILPTTLTRGGLRAGVSAFVARLDLPVEVDLAVERFRAEIEASAYFVVAESLTNVVKHSQAQRAEVRAHVEDELLLVEIRDDGIGGADPDGHGLIGMYDRVTALGGRLEIESPAGGGTLVAATLPLSAV